MISYLNNSLSWYFIGYRTNIIRLLKNHPFLITLFMIRLHFLLNETFYLCLPCFTSSSKEYLTRDTVRLSPDLLPPEKYAASNRKVYCKDFCCKIYIREKGLIHCNLLNALHLAKCICIHFPDREQHGTSQFITRDSQNHAHFCLRVH